MNSEALTENQARLVLKLVHPLGDKGIGFLLSRYVGQKELKTI